MEADRFCRFLNSKVVADRSIAAEVGPVLARDAATLATALRESQTES
jgi:hypothetical protein